jgi:hypothetical protein
MDGAQMHGGWFAKSKCGSFDSSAHADSLRMTGAHVGYRYPTSQNRDVGHPIVSASWRCFPCPQRRGTSAPDMGRPKVGEEFLRSHSFVRDGERMDGAQMRGGWFAKSKCRSFDSSAHAGSLRMTGAHMGYRYPTSQNRDVGHPIVAASWRCFPCPQRRVTSTPGMGHPKVGQEFLRSHPFVRGGERMGGAQMCGDWFAKNECG